MSENPRLDPPGFEDYRKTVERINTLNWARDTNARSIADFQQKLNNWKQNMIVASSKTMRDNGVPLPIPPTPPMLETIDLDKFSKWFDDVHHTGDVRPKDYYIYTRMEVPASDWDLMPPNPNAPKQNTGKPVGDKDPITGKGWFQFVLGSVKADGSAYKPGDVWTDPATDIDYELRAAVREHMMNVGVHPLRWAALGIAKPSPEFA